LRRRLRPGHDRPLLHEPPARQRGPAPGHLLALLEPVLPAPRLAAAPDRHGLPDPGGRSLRSEWRLHLPWGAAAERAVGPGHADRRLRPLGGSPKAAAR